MTRVYGVASEVRKAIIAGLRRPNRICHGKSKGEILGTRFYELYDDASEGFVTGDGTKKLFRYRKSKREILGAYRSINKIRIGSVSVGN